MASTIDAARGSVLGPVYDLEGTRLDPLERRLERNGLPVAVTPKAFDLLVHLVERAGRLVEKRALMEALWPGTFVEEANLAFQVSSLRKVLDGNRPVSMIQTVPTRGYRFVGGVTVVNGRVPPATAADPPVRPGGRGQDRRAAVVLAATFAGLAAVVLMADLNRGSGLES